MLRKETVVNGLTTACFVQAVFTILPIRFVRALQSVGAFDQRGKHRKMKLQGQQLTDVLCVLMFALTFLFLNSLDAGAIYFWMKDLTQEFLKLQVIYTAVEIFDKVHGQRFVLPNYSRKLLL